MLWFMGRKESNMTEQLNCCEYIHTCVVVYVHMYKKIYTCIMYEQF